MKDWLAKLIGGGLVGIGEGIAGIVDRFVQTPDEKTKAMIEIEALLQKGASELEHSMRTELQTKERIIVAELNSGDAYTRRARPTLVYFGMAVIFLNYVLFPKLSIIFTSVPKDSFTPVVLPDLFWWAWGGAVGIWSIGRTMERRGSNQEMVKVITGNSNPTSLFE